jgi:hypothetical protein
MFFMALACSASAQKYWGTKPQTPIKPTRTFPVFLDATKLKKDLSCLKELKIIYKELEKREVGAGYNYGFYVDTLGRAVLTHPEKAAYMVSLNKYVRDVFSKYRWVPAHRLDCKKCLLRSSAYFEVSFNTEEKRITVKLGFVEENGHVAFSEIIYM